MGVSSNEARSQAKIFLSLISLSASLSSSSSYITEKSVLVEADCFISNCSVVAVTAATDAAAATLDDRDERTD